jgi:DNA-binding beta-propeller fold protein YncE
VIIRPVFNCKTGFGTSPEASDVFNRPTDVAWDAAGNIFVADGIGNSRVAKFNSKGVFIKSWGSTGKEPGLFGSVLAIAVDAQGNVYAAGGGNKRIQVFDNNGAPEDIDVAGEIYKMKLDGTIVGKFGKAGKLPREFGTVNSIDCRSENNLLVGEIGNMRVQKLIMH